MAQVATATMDAFLTGIRKAFEQRKHTDFTITCHGREWRVHKVILCAHSDFFDHACAGPFTVSTVFRAMPWSAADTPKEAQQNRIDLQNDDPAAVAAMVEFFYEFAYEDYKIAKEYDISESSLHHRVCSIADKYFIQALFDYAKPKFVTSITARWHEASFAQVIAEVFTGDGAHHEVRENVLRVVHQRRAQLYAGGSEMDHYRLVTDALLGFAPQVIAHEYAPNKIEDAKLARPPSPYEEDDWAELRNITV